VFELITEKLDVIKTLFPVMLLVGVVTIAIVERVKAEWKPEKNFWFTLISMVIGAALFALFLYAPPIVIAFLFVGLLASGVFDITSYFGNKK
jgi:uncharacterized membrane protein HdeD (DUF308 family)